MDGAYSRNSLPKIKDEAKVINLDEYKSIGAHWVAIHVKKTFQDISIVLVLNIFLKALKQIFLEYKHMIGKCVDRFLMDLFYAK